MEKKYAIGIDLGGTSVKYALIDNKGVFHFQGRLPSKANVSACAVTEQILSAINRVMDFASENELRVEGIGIGTPGIVDAASRKVLGGAENIKGWENIALAEIVENATGLQTYVGNDANMMGLGESRFGAGKGFSDIVFITVGTGIGGAVVIGGKLFGGYANRGTELGHVPLMADGEKCACGAIGCLEHYASASALVRMFTAKAAEYGYDLSGQAVDGELIVRLYKENHPLAVDCLNLHCRYLGQGIAGFINIFSPQRVVIGGGLADAGPFYIEKVSREAMRFAISDCAVNTRLVAASLGNRAGSLGAASLVFDRC